jgi:hypothetical protein
MKRLVLLAAVMAFTALSADIAGTWKATAEGPNGTLERTFVFRVDGNKLTGETTSPVMGKSVIQDGKVEGDQLSFSIVVNFQGTEMKVNYKGKVAGDQMTLTAESADGDFRLEWRARKVS